MGCAITERLSESAEGDQEASADHGGTDAQPELAREDQYWGGHFYISSRQRG